VWRRRFALSTRACNMGLDCSSKEGHGDCVPPRRQGTHGLGPRPQCRQNCPNSPYNHTERGKGCQRAQSSKPYGHALIRDQRLARSGIPAGAAEGNPHLLLEILFHGRGIVVRAFRLAMANVQFAYASGDCGGDARFLWNRRHQLA